MKLNRNRILAITFLLLQGCAHSSKEKKLDEKISQEPDVKNRAELRAEVNQLIETSPNLDSDQKSKLSSLRDSTRKQTDQIAEESLKLRSALMKDLIASQYDDDEVTLIKKRLKDLEDKRLTVLFDAVEQTNSILGHQSPENEKVMQYFLYEPHTQRYN